MNNLGGDLFFTELYKIDEDGSIEWESDGGVAMYNPTAYETQRLWIPSGSSGRYTQTIAPTFLKSRASRTEPGALSPATVQLASSYVYKFFAIALHGKVQSVSEFSGRAGFSIFALVMFPTHHVPNLQRAIPSHCVPL